MTQKVMNRIRSRPGKGSPASVVTGTARAAASDTAPRMPAQATSVRACQVPRRARWAGRRSRARTITVMPKTQANRVAITTALTAAP